MSFLTGGIRDVSKELVEGVPDPGAERDLLTESRGGLIGRCANPGCRSGWLQLFRKRTRPVFEGGWNCSPECTEARVQLALRREVDGVTQDQSTHRHRIPLGLLMLEKGFISGEQLRRAVDAQRKEGSLRIGEWLVKQGATDEASVARALSVQWSCPVLSARGFSPSAMAGVMPRILVERFGALPIRIAGNSILYLGFEESVDWAFALSLRKMTGLRVECGIVPSSEFKDASKRMLKQKFPTVQVTEAVSSSSAARALAKTIERVQPVSSRLVRVHQLLWLRMFSKPENTGMAETCAATDVLCRIGGF
jgi:hypothetical protein